MKDTGKIRVLCVDDHPVVRDGIAAIINLQPDMMLAGAAAAGGEALERFCELRPDVTLVDLQLPDDAAQFDVVRFQSCHGRREIARRRLDVKPQLRSR